MLQPDHSARGGRLSPAIAGRVHRAVEVPRPPPPVDDHNGAAMKALMEQHDLALNAKRNAILADQERARTAVKTVLNQQRQEMEAQLNGNLSGASQMLSNVLTGLTADDMATHTPVANHAAQCYFS